MQTKYYCSAVTAFEQGPVLVATETFPLERTEARSMLFTEQEAFWTLPLHETAVIADVAVTKGNITQRLHLYLILNGVLVFLTEQNLTHVTVFFGN